MGAIGKDYVVTSAMGKLVAYSGVSSIEDMPNGGIKIWDTEGNEVYTYGPSGYQGYAEQRDEGGR
jgi:hypothetical protein